MIVVTGALGFIGSYLIGELNNEGILNIVAVDDFAKKEKFKNLENKTVKLKVERQHFDKWLNNNNNQIDFIFHLGARTDTAEFDINLLDALNTEYSKMIWRHCTTNNIPLLYASSAATYGMGEFGFDDSHEIIEKLKPLNPYGISKNEFDKWVLKQTNFPDFWAGMKFFNVYGPNEYHKNRMASVVMHSYNQINAKNEINLFKSHNPNFKDGEQLRDFIYVRDVVNVLIFLMKQKPKSGIYNLGTGKARSFYDLAKATFDAMNLPYKVNFIDTPIDIRNKYQYFTQANMLKIKSIGYNKEFTSLEDGINDYVTNYLNHNKYF